MDTQESMSEHTALEICTDLSLDETGNGRALPSCPSQKRLELFANDLVQKRLLGFMAFVLDGDKTSLGIMRSSTLPTKASDVPKAPWRDDSDATSQPCAPVRHISVPSNNFHIESAGSRVRRRHMGSTLTPTNARMKRTHQTTYT